MQIGELFRKAAVGGFALLNPAFYSGELPVDNVNIVFCLISLLQKRFSFGFQFCNCLSLLTRILLPFRFYVFNAFLDARDSQCDFSLFLFEFFERDNLAAKFGEIGRLSSAFASQVNFTFLQESSLVAKRHARALPLDFQRHLAETCANKTHGVTLYECRVGKRNFHRVGGC